MANRPVVTIKN